MVTRRGFVKGGVVALTAPWFGGCRSGAAVGMTYPGWKPGELDIHFIHTGGEHARDPDPDAHHIRAGVAVAVTLAFAEAL